MLNRIINKITKTVKNLDESYNLFEQEIYKLFVSHCNNIKKLYWETSQHLSSFSGASACFSQLYHLSIDIRTVNSNALYEITQNCKKNCIF